MGVKHLATEAILERESSSALHDQTQKEFMPIGFSNAALLPENLHQRARRLALYRGSFALENQEACAGYHPTQVLNAFSFLY